MSSNYGLVNRVEDYIYAPFHKRRKNRGHITFQFGIVFGIGALISTLTYGLSTGAYNRISQRIINTTGREEKIILERKRDEIGSRKNFSLVEGAVCGTLATLSFAIFYAPFSKKRYPPEFPEDLGVPCNIGPTLSPRSTKNQRELQTPSAFDNYKK